MGSSFRCSAIVVAEGKKRPAPVPLTARSARKLAARLEQLRLSRKLEEDPEVADSARHDDSTAD